MEVRLIIMAVLLFFGFRIISRLNKALHYSSRYKHHVSYSLPVFELVAWLSYLIWCVKHIYLSQNYFGLVSFSIVTLVICVPATFLLRDFIAGIYLKVQNRIVVGCNIRFEAVSGLIQKAGHFNVEIETKSGDNLSVPYSKLRSVVLTKGGKNASLEKIVLDFTYQDVFKLSELSAELIKQLLNSPWVVVSQVPVVEDVKHVNANYHISVCAYVLNTSFKEKIREQVGARMNVLYGLV